VSTLSLHVTTAQHSPEVVVVQVGGVGEERLLLMLIDGIEAIADDAACVVIDIDDLVLFSATAVQRFVGALLERLGDTRVAFCARRGSARLVLRRWGGSGVVIVSSPDDVCDRRHAVAG
jgi:hypothetical protein